MAARSDSYENLPKEQRGGVIAIGNFDGIHRGHQAVLQNALEIASKAGGAPTIALTFEPHPRAVFSPHIVLPRITPAHMKAKILGKMGFDAVIEVPFNMDFASKTADQFVNEVLVAGLGAHHVVTGFDFHFGKNRQGGPAYLMEAGKRAGFEVTLVDALRDANADVISSSRIRELLASGELAAANALLGYRYRVSAAISGGKQLGRTLGYPTANMKLPDDTPLAHGIYAVRFTRADGPVHDGVASFGRRPTVAEDGAPLLETFVFDFDDDLYGEECTVSLCAYLRGEEKFDGLDALIVQMKKDEAQARAILANLKPLSGLDAVLTFEREQKQ